MARYISNMGTRRVEQGDVGHIVAGEIKQRREARQLSLRELSDRLAALGRPILPSGLSKIESGARRVDVDDLVAIADALGTVPGVLLVGANRDDVRDSVRVGKVKRAAAQLPREVQDKMLSELVSEAASNLTRDIRERLGLYVNASVSVTPSRYLEQGSTFMGAQPVTSSVVAPSTVRARAVVPDGTTRVEALTDSVGISDAATFEWDREVNASQSDDSGQATETSEIVKEVDDGEHRTEEG